MVLAPTVIVTYISQKVTFQVISFNILEMIACKLDLFIQANSPHTENFITNQCTDLIAPLLVLRLISQL